MSIYDFYPMKKRRICKTPNGGRTGSTLGKLKKTSDQLASAADSGIEVLWDNNSPSPTTTLALAGKRRRKHQANTKNGGCGTTDISFVVQKLSENTSPVVENTHSTLLEMWVGKDDGNIEHDEEFTSPPNQIRQQEKSNIILSTPLNKRSRTTKKKASRQFMLEVRKLVDEIQKSDLGSSGSQRNSQNLREQHQLQTLRTQEEINSPTALAKRQTSTQIVPEINIAPTNGAANDSFEWTEDDMDELILTCQLSSSGKGTLDEPCHTKPQFGLSPSSILVEETQVLFDDTLAETCENQEPLAGSSHNVPGNITGDGWEMNFGDDDSLLESAAQQFELSQQTASKQSLGATDPMMSVATRTYHASNASVANPAHFTKLHDKGIQFDVRLNTSTPVSKSAKNAVEITSASNKGSGERAKTKSTIHVGSDQMPVESLTEVNGMGTLTKNSGGNLLANRHGQRLSCQRSGESVANTKKPGKNEPSKMVRENNGIRESTESVSTKKSCLKEETCTSNNNRFSLPFQKSNEIPYSQKCDENFESNRTTQFNNHLKTSLKSPLKGRSENLTLNRTKSEIFITSNGSAISPKQLDKSCIFGNNLKNSTTALSKVSSKKGVSIDENDIKCLLSEENLDALLEDFNLEDMCFAEDGGSSIVTKTCKTINGTPTQASLPSQSTATKQGCTEQEIERKRLEAQRRRLAKRQAVPKYKRERPR